MCIDEAHARGRSSQACLTPPRTTGLPTQLEELKFLQGSMTLLAPVRDKTK